MADAKRHFEAGQRAYAKGRLRAARDAFERAYALLPSPELAFNLGRVHERLAQRERAMGYYKRYLELAQPSDRDREEVARRLAALESAGDRVEGMLRQAPPKSDELQAEARRFFQRGASLYRRGRFRGALAAFTAALALSKLPELYFNLAMTSHKLGARRDTIDYYRAYLVAAPQAPDRNAIEAEITRLRTLP